MYVLIDGQNGDRRALLVENGNLFLAKTFRAPIISSAFITPNPTAVGQAVLISVSAVDGDYVPSA